MLGQKIVTYPWLEKIYLLVFTKEHLNNLLQVSSVFSDIQNNLENTNALRTHFLTQGRAGKRKLCIQVRA